MTAIAFAPAVRRQVKARVALCGPSGSGKTYTGLTTAFALGSKVAVIDTERESADGYQGLNGWQWDSFKPESFDPQTLIDALAAAAAAGYDVVLIDSLSHFWMGTGGILEQVDNGSSTTGGNKFGGWKAVRPMERRMIDAMVGYPGHIIATMRTKTEYVVEQDDRGKKVPKKIGLKPEQREGIEYEFSIVADLDHDNVLTVSKTRVPTLKRARMAEPGVEFGQAILDWFDDGAEGLPDVNDYRDRALDKNATADDLKALWYEVRDRHLLAAAVVNDEGDTVPLGDLIVAKGHEAAKPAVAA